MQLSRIQMLNPQTYISMPAPVRKIAIRDMVTSVGAGLGVLAMAKRSGLDVGIDPKDPGTFGKIMDQETGEKWDIWAGGRGYAALVALAAAQLADGKLTEAEQGKLSRVAGKRGEAILSPLPSLVLDAFRGETFSGEPFDALSDTGKKWVPMIAQDVQETLQARGDTGRFGILPALFGVGVQVYESKKKGQGAANGK
jgi:hypothetical protein